MKKKICSILILIVLLLNSSVMPLIGYTVEAIVDAIDSIENDVQTVQEVALEKYINYANELETGTMVQLRVGVGIQKEEEIYIEGITTIIECPTILGNVPNRVEVLGKEASYKDGKITIQESYEEKVKYEEKKEYTIILFYDANCYTSINEERILDVKVTVVHEIEKEIDTTNETKIASKSEKVTETIQGESTIQIIIYP